MEAIQQMTIGDNIRYYREAKGYSQPELAGFLGVSKGAISQYETGSSKPTIENLISIAKILGVTILDLVNPEEPGSPDGETGVIAHGNIGSVSRNIREYRVEVPFLSAKAQAGIPRMTYETFSLKWIEETYAVFLPVVVISEKHLVIEIVGDSMESEIKDGARVLAEAVTRDDIRYESGGVYAVLYGSSRFVIKRIKTNDLNINGTLRLWSDNDKYGHIDVHGEDILFMWKVLGKVWEPMR